MNILKVVDANDRGGVFTCEKQVIGELKRRNINVDLVILGSGASLIEYEKMCRRTYHLPLLDANYGGSFKNIMYSIFKTYRYGLKYSAYLKEQVTDTQYDAVIYQRAIFIHFVGMLSILIKSKGMWHLPNVARTSFSRNYYNYFCKKYNLVQLANSFYTKSTLGQQCEHVIYPGFDGVRVGMAERNYREKLRIDKSAPVYGIAARMHKDKAQDLVVEAFVNSDVPAAGGHLVIAGGPLDSEFAQLVKQKAGHLLHSRVHFMGELDNISDFYASIDVVVNGRRNVEPFGISIAEAMGAGKPVIAYKLGGPSEMIRHNETGWLVERPISEDFRKMFNVSIENKSKWTEMGKKAKEHSVEFSIEKNIDKLLKIINKEVTYSSSEIFDFSYSE